jgi:hypothetical protein
MGVASPRRCTGGFAMDEEVVLMTAPVDPSVPPSGMGCVECDEILSACYNARCQ